MNILIIAAGIIFFAGTLFRNYSGIVKPDDPILQNTITIQTDITPPSVTPTNTPSLVLSPTVKVVSTESSKWYEYPGSRKLSGNESPQFFETEDDAGTVTSWFENTIRSRRMNVTSFVKTKTNGNSNNTLSASSPNEKISIIISQKTDEAKTTIQISI